MPRRKKSPRNTASPQPSPLQVSTFHNVEILNISGGNFVATRASRDTDEGGVGMDSGPGSVKPPHDIYYDQLLVQKKGSPMWIPGPDMNLPKEYKTRGIGIGDVGVLYCAQGFHFLFNIFLPANDPINEGRVPDGFVPLDYSTLRLGMMAQPSQKIEYTSLSVRKSGSLNSSFVFESSATEGAILVLPDGGVSEDLVTRKSIKNYLAENAELWYEFVRDKRELEVNNGDIRLVIGLDKASSWGIATFASSAREPVRLVFNSARQGAASRVYTWNCDGTAQVRVGPEGEAMGGFSHSDRSPLRNQCVFIRTVNFDLSGVIWDALDVHRIRSGGRFSGSPPSGPSRNQPSGASSNQSDNFGSQSQFKGGNVQHSMQRSAVNHPSNAINKQLLAKNPNAQIAITEDADWISVIEKGVKMPDLDEICARVLNTHEIYKEAGIVTFKSEDSETPVRRPSMSKGIIGFMQTMWKSVTHSARNLPQVVVCIGPYGSGKSQLIDCLTMRTDWAYHGMKPECHPVRTIKTKIPGDDRSFTLVDTPGFDDYPTTAEDVLEDVADWLTKSQGKDIKIFILYLHDITTNRLTVPPPMNLLTRLCGNNAARQFALVTTHWDNVELGRGTAREAELKVRFQTLLISGATIARFDKTTESAWKVVKPLLSQ